VGAAADEVVDDGDVNREALWPRTLADGLYIDGVPAKTSSTRLLALTTSQEDGGAEVYLRTVLAAATERGMTVTAALPPLEATAALRQDLDRAGVVVRPLHAGRQAGSATGAALAVMRDAVEVGATILRTRPDRILINLPTTEATPGGMLACALSNVPTTAVFHLVRPGLEVTAPRRGLYRLARSRRQHWVCVSEDNRATLTHALGISPASVEVIRNGVPGSAPLGAERRSELREALGLDPGSTVVLTTGRLNAQKGHGVIVDALSQLVAAEPTITFVWAGDGPLRQELEDAVHASGLADHVRMLGHRTDVAELLCAADLFLFPSRFEGGAPAFALVEAMSAGLPVLVSDAPALTEVIDDGVTGLVFRRDDAADLSRAVGWALSHRAELRAMAERARERVLSDYSVDAMIDTTLRLVCRPGS
jgi:glycosyltransferase involved in cell wall biosynthesis